MAGNAEEAAKYLRDLPLWIRQRVEGVDRKNLRELAYAALLMSDGPENPFNSDIQRQSPDVDNWRTIIDQAHPQHSRITVTLSALMNTFVVYQRLTAAQMVTAKEVSEEEFAQVAEPPTWD